MYLDLAKKLGAHHTFAKPVNNDELILTIKKLVG
jgi:hypothetical protein